MLDISQISLDQGVLGICPMPGRLGLYEADLQTIVRWQPGLVLTMTPLSELERAGAAEFPNDLAQAGIKWLRCPIADFCAPAGRCGARASARGVPLRGGNRCAKALGRAGCREGAFLAAPAVVFRL